jgi:hypothetical protein
LTPGTVLHDPTFEFSDSSIPGNKILIVLNDASSVGHFTIVKTTSNPGLKTEAYGCNLKDRYPNFYIPTGRCVLRENTWVCLDEYFDFSYQKWLKKCMEEKDVQTLGQLPDETLAELLTCSINSEDISHAQEADLRNTLSKIDPANQIFKDDIPF